MYFHTVGYRLRNNQTMLTFMDQKIEFNKVNIFEITQKETQQNSFLCQLEMSIY